MTQKLAQPLLLGRVASDSNGRGSRTTLCNVEVPLDSTAERGVYVYIEDSVLHVRLIGRIIDGPYFFEDGPNYSRSSANSRQTRKVCIVELLSVATQGSTSLVQTRPSPGSMVYAVPSEEVQRYLGVRGDLFFGRLASDKNIRLCFDSQTLNRHVGIFGTTGSGKSNTLQVLAEEAARIGSAVVIFDVEGEYSHLDKPAELLHDTLSEFGEAPSGVRDSRFYVPASDDSVRPDARKFTLQFRKLNLDVFGEVLGLTSQERLMLLDLVRKTKEYLGFEPYTLRTVVDRLGKQLEGQMDKPTLPENIADATMSLYTKLATLEKLGTMDAELPEIEVKEIMVPGRVSVIDLSGSTDAVRNVVIAYQLDAIFRARIAEPGFLDSPLLILVEEVHTFISREKRERMQGTLSLMTELARRGRKRGISLGLVSQQPVSLPPELFETINTRIIHRLSSVANLQVLRESTGNVPESLWETVPSLSKGEALVVSPNYKNAVIALIRPAASKRLTADLEPSS